MGAPGSSEYLPLAAVLMSAVIMALGGIRAAVFAAVAAVAIVATGVQSWRLDSAQAGRDEWRRTADSVLAANATNQETIADLQEANRKWSDLWASRQQQAAALAAVSSERDALKVELARRRANRGALYENEPEAAAWGRTRVPDSVADSLRQ
jgi:hypothetical protein